MKNSERVSVYFIGFIIGMAIVSILLARRARQAEQVEDPWHAHHEQVDQAGVEPLPEGVEPSILGGDVLRFGYLPSVEEPIERVWLMNFRKSYPYVRVVETIDTGAIRYMAADQIRVKLADGVDVTALTPMLDGLKLRLRMFNRKEHLVVLGVLSTEIDAVPATLEAIEPWAEFFADSGPDWIEFKDRSE